MLANLLDIAFHVDKYFGLLLENYGTLVYFILFAVIFIETGFVLIPFLPGDSLLFVAGTFAGAGSLNIWLVFFFLSVAAILGDTVNYWIGHFFGEKVFAKSRLYRKDYADKTKDFFRKYGAKTIVLARFVPIIRTLAPFIAGVGKMNYIKFLGYNIVGGLAWVALFVFGGYYFGSLPAIKSHFSLVIVCIILISLMPMAWEIFRHRLQKRM